MPGFADFNRRVRRRGGFVLPNGPRDSRTFATSTGKAMITVNELVPVECPPGRLILQTIRSHDQFNTTTYSLNDRYRGIHGGRDVVFVNPDDLLALKLADGDRVDVASEWPGEPDRWLRNQRVVAYPTSRGCAAAYFPEANVLVSLSSTALGSNTPGVQGGHRATGAGSDLRQLRERLGRPRVQRHRRVLVPAGRAAVHDDDRLARRGRVPHEPQPRLDGQRRPGDEQRVGGVDHRVGPVHPLARHVLAEVDDVGLEHPAAHRAVRDDEVARLLDHGVGVGRDLDVGDRGVRRTPGSAGRAAPRGPTG